jgi:hypothetical protein
VEDILLTRQQRIVLIHEPNVHGRTLNKHLLCIFVHSERCPFPLLYIVDLLGFLGQLRTTANRLAGRVKNFLRARIKGIERKMMSSKIREYAKTNKHYTKEEHKWGIPILLFDVGLII